ncbi:MULTISPECIES: hypothetical protein [unclassified Streptomyces]|uniref:hypothetical protein n=1 Tax=unclassified Streptomyces TaxID=2593676 RepID=UPI0035DA6936
MRPQRFSELVVDIAKNSPTADRVQTLAESGDTKHPFGVVVTVGTTDTRWQFTGQLPEGAKHEGFLDEPVAGTPVPTGEPPRKTDSPEAWLAAALAQAASPEISAVERWSTQPEAASQSGLTITFHNGARVFARAF